jgi:magnesium chelatase subunit D
MSPGTEPQASAWWRALQAAAIFAADPAAVGGIWLRAGVGPVREAWAAHLRALLPQHVPQRTLPNHVSDERLLGGLDLTATLRTGRPQLRDGLLAEVDGGVLWVPMAERVQPAVAAQLARTIDRREVALERDGVSKRQRSAFGVVAFDEGEGDAEPLPAALGERLALIVDLQDISWRDAGLQPHAAAGDAPGAADRAAWQAAVERARMRHAQVAVDDAQIAQLCVTAARLGIASLRAPLQAVAVARMHAALDARDRVDDDDLSVAAQLVFALRATQWPADDEPDTADDDVPPPDADAGEDTPQPGTEDELPDELVLDAVKAAMPAGLLLQLQAQGPASRSRRAGRAGATRLSLTQGRPAGVRRGEPRGGARLSLIATLRAAAPWQPLRRREAGAAVRGRAVIVRRDDLHVQRHRQRRQTTTMFVVDASGSSALQRLAEAKGAVELLLAECYVRRDRVALIAFRGTQAELLLPPTRSLVRAKRSLAALPGGGGTPLAHGIDAARQLADNVLRAGDSVAVVLLTDGRANIARDGAPGRARAAQDALQAARALGSLPVTALVVDTSPQPQREAEQLAQAMHATYLPLPHASAHAVDRAVRSAIGAAASSR